MKKLIVFAVLAAMACSAGAVTIHVPADQPTIQAGIEASSRGDTVLVAPGAYTERLIYPEHRVTVLSAEGPTTTYLIAPPPDYSYNIVEAHTRDSGSSFEGFTVTGVNGLWHVISIYESPYFRIANNRVINNRVKENVIHSGGVHTGQNQATIITRNLIAHFPTGAAINVTSDWCQVTNNTIYRGPCGLDIRGENCLVQNNVVVGLETWAIIETQTGTEVDYNNFWDNGDNSGAGPNGISADPLFYDPVAGDFNLQPSSPCIDAGDPAPEFDDPDGSRNDMGAYWSGSLWPTAYAVGMTSEAEPNVVNHIPEIEWIFSDPEGGMQAAFELEIGTDLDWAAAEMWATGEVWSSFTSFLYSGLPLEDGITYYLRLRVNNGTDWGEWVYTPFRMNSVPEVPVPEFPTAGMTVRFDNAFLRVLNAADAEKDTLVYDFELYSDPSLTALVYSEYGVEEQSNRTATEIIPSLQIGSQYWWRARSYDGFEYSDWLDTESFAARAEGTIEVPDGCATIQDAIDVSLNGDTVLVAPGTYYGFIDYAGKELVLLSSDGPAVTMIQAYETDALDGFDRIADIDAEMSVETSSAAPLGTICLINGEGQGAVLDGFSVRNPSGWGIYCNESSPIIQNCNITGCYASFHGSGIWCVNSGAIIRNNTIHHNRAAYSAGGVGGYGTVTPDIYGNMIYSNIAGTGAGICFKEPTENVRIHHNLLYDNLGKDNGTGVISVYGTNSEIINNTVVMNEAGGISVFVGDGVNILNNIVVSNSYVGLVPGSAYHDYNDVWGNGSGNLLGPNGMSVDPLFVDSEGNDFRLSPGSPCIDAGHPDAIYNDPDDTRNDLGAFPMAGTIPMASYINMAPDEMTNVVNHTPIIQWTFYDTVGSQIAYEIEVGTDPWWSTADLWATGEVYTGDNFATYAGEPLLDGDTYYLRIRVHNGNEWGGWSPRTFTMNSLPSVPALVYPVAMLLLRTETVYLKVANSSDAESETLLYDFEVYGDEGLTNLVTSQYGVAEQPDFTIWSPVPGLEGERQYWWRARSSDGYEHSEWSGAETFLTTDRGPITILVPQDTSSIQAAITGALDGDTILVAPGTYAEYVDFLGKAIVLTSVGGRDVTFISLPEPPTSPALDLSVPVDSSRVVPMVDAGEPLAAVTFATGEGESTVLEGFTITNPTGRGVYCSGSSPIIRYCDIRYCNAGEEVDGGGILCLESAARIQYNLIHHNQAGKTGAGVGGSGSAIAEISHNLIYDNESPHGPGIGFFAPASNLNIHHNVVWDNTSESGGMGAVYLNGTNSRIGNNTIVSNTTGITIYADGGTGVEILNNIVASNEEAGIVPSVAYYDYNDVWDNPAANDPGPNGISLDPLFTKANTGDFTLLEASPCIDAGHPDPIYNDPDGTRNDIGAYYFAQVVGCCLLRGDVDHGGAITPLDIVYFVNWLWREGAVPPCLDEVDVNADGSVDPSDCLYLANYMWNSGPPPIPCP